MTEIKNIITCPLCGSDQWTLSIWGDGLRVTCANRCGVDNVTTFDSSARVVWDLIRDERKNVEDP